MHYLFFRFWFTGSELFPLFAWSPIYSRSCFWCLIQFSGFEAAAQSLRSNFSPRLVFDAPLFSFWSSTFSVLWFCARDPARSLRKEFSHSLDSLLVSLHFVSWSCSKGATRDPPRASVFSRTWVSPAAAFSVLRATDFGPQLLDLAPAKFAAPVTRNHFSRSKSWFLHVPLPGSCLSCLQPLICDLSSLLVLDAWQCCSGSSLSLGCFCLWHMSRTACAASNCSCVQNLLHKSVVVLELSDQKT
jgi:hypothetical protein